MSSQYTSQLPPQFPLTQQFTNSSKTFMLFPMLPTATKNTPACSRTMPRLFWEARRRQGETACFPVYFTHIAFLEAISSPIVASSRFPVVLLLVSDPSTSPFPISMINPTQQSPAPQRSSPSVKPCGQPSSPARTTHRKSTLSAPTLPN